MQECLAERSILLTLHSMFEQLTFFEPTSSIATGRAASFLFSLEEHIFRVLTKCNNTFAPTSIIDCRGDCTDVSDKTDSLACWSPVKFFSKLNYFIFGYFDPTNIFFDKKM